MRSIIESEDELKVAERLATLEQKWRSGSGKVRTPVYQPDSPLLKQLGLRKTTSVTTVHDPEKLVCSFCGTQVDRVNATHGTGQPRKSSKLVVYDEEDPATFEERIIHSSKKVVACPNCVLSIKPITTRNKLTGEVTVVSSAIDFPTDE